VEGPEPTPFCLIQCRAFAMFPEGHTGLVPGAYHLLAGRMPIAEATLEELVLSARQTFQQLIPLPPKLLGSLMEHGKGIWRGRYGGCVPVSGQHSISSWFCRATIPLRCGDCRNQRRSHCFLPRAPQEGPFARFFKRRGPTTPTEQSIEEGLQVIATGMVSLQAAHGWWQEHESTCHPQT